MYHVIKHIWYYIEYDDSACLSAKWQWENTEKNVCTKVYISNVKNILHKYCTIFW